MVSQRQRAGLRALRQAIDDSRLAAEIKVRIYRNALIMAIAILLSTAAILPVAVPLLPLDLNVLRPLAAGGSPTRSLISMDVVTIELWGAVGGLIGLIVALRGLQSSRHPVRLQLVQLLLKPPAAAITYAILFGFAQEAFTTFVDRHANRLLDQAQPVSEKA
jgi:hypothetical protein